MNAYSREYCRKWKHSNTARKLYVSAKARAKEYGREFTITVSDIVVPANCPVLGLPFALWAEDKHTAPSLDRIDSAGGYTPDNIRVISRRANLLKSNATIAEMEAVLAYMKSECK